MVSGAFVFVVSASAHKKRSYSHALFIVLMLIFTPTYLIYAYDMKQGKILIIDDNEDVLFALNLLLEPYVEQIRVTTQPERIEHFMESYVPDVILLDMNFRRDAISGQEGFFWLEKIKKADPDAVVLFITAYADTEKAVRAIKAGATDFIPKPWEKEKLLATLSAALKLRESRTEVRSLKRQVAALESSDEEGFEIIGESNAMQEIFVTIEKLRHTDANILILGENGTGKDLVARALYHHSPRNRQVFVSIDLGSIAESLFESELFGYEKGAFTDARRDKPEPEYADAGQTAYCDREAADHPAGSHPSGFDRCPPDLRYQYEYSCNGGGGDFPPGLALPYQHHRTAYSSSSGAW